MNKVNVASVEGISQASGIKIIAFLFILISCVYIHLFCSNASAREIKYPNVSGRFYPADADELSRLLEEFFADIKPPEIKGDILVLISPHAGYEFSGKTAAYGYKIIQNREYDTILILGPSHYVNFKGAILYSKGAFRTPLGDVYIDEDLCHRLMLSSSLFSLYPEAFSREHSIEVQLPFLQKVLKDFKIVPILLGQVDFSECETLAEAIRAAIKDRNCLLVASSDMYHGFNYQEGELKDMYTLSLIRELDSKRLYECIQNQEAQLCGWAGVVISILIAERLGYTDVAVANYTNSSQVMNRKQKGEYCVGYGSVIIYNSSDKNKQGNSALNNQDVKYAGSDADDKDVPISKMKEEFSKGGAMLNDKQKRRLLEIARTSIEYYLNNRKRLEITEEDPALLEHCGAFVTLHQHGQLRGCIGNLIANQPLYLTVRDMAIEAAVGDPRFRPLGKEELKDIEIEISVLSPLRRIDSPDEIKMGEHGVLIKKGYRSGVFLPQVATETGWSKEEFLSNLCAHKAGLEPLAWKDPSTEIYIFTAEVFSE